MLFSERYGYKEIVESLHREEMPESLRTRIWNIFYEYIFEKLKVPLDTFIPEFVDNFVLDCWDAFFKKELKKLRDTSPYNTLNYIRNLFLELQWFEVYDFIEFFATHFPNDSQISKDEVLQAINNLLKEEKAPYRVIEGKVVPLTSEEEIKEIEKALNVPDKFKGTKAHIDKALKLMSDRKNPDYENSIKESISALESLVQVLLGEKGTLGGLLKKLDIHPAMKQGFSNLYGWTCDEGGIRHGKFGEALEPCEKEARYMLNTISAFINYLIDKFH